VTTRTRGFRVFGLTRARASLPHYLSFPASVCDRFNLTPQIYETFPVVTAGGLQWLVASQTAPGWRLTSGIHIRQSGPPLPLLRHPVAARAPKHKKASIYFRICQRSSLSASVGRRERSRYLRSRRRTGKRSPYARRGLLPPRDAIAVPTSRHHRRTHASDQQ
jgi:hypothetical protein